jgi:hypothetical protein
MHQIVGIDLNNRLFPSSSYHEGETQITRGCQTYGEAASAVSINQNVSQLFELFFKGFPNPLWLPYLDNDNLTLPCEFSFETGDTPAERLVAVENRVDEVATHGIRLGTTLGLAAMATHTGVDYSTRPRGFQGGVPEDIDEIEVSLERLDGHDDAITELTHPQSVLNRLFD